MLGMFVGFGVGLVMQTLVVVVQNAVPRGMMGIATASAQFSRQVGGMIGVTAMGAIMTVGLGGASPGAAAPAELAAAIRPVFFLGLVLTAVAFAATLFLPHTELRDRIEPAASARPAPETT
jgi:hypothetical protein